jgi:hypothetical protein
MKSLYHRAAIAAILVSGVPAQKSCEFAYKEVGGWSGQLVNTQADLDAKIAEGCTIIE